MEIGRFLLKANEEELAVLRLLASGKSVKQIALELCMARNSIYKRLERLYTRNEIRSGHQMISAVVWFVRTGERVELVGWQPGTWITLGQECFRENIDQKQNR